MPTPHKIKQEVVDHGKDTGASYIEHAHTLLCDRIDHNLDGSTKTIKKVKNEKRDSQNNAAATPSFILRESPPSTTGYEAHKQARNVFIFSGCFQFVKKTITCSAV